MKERLNFAITTLCISIATLCISQNISLAVSHNKITLETAIQRAIQQNSAINVIRQKINVSKAQFDRIPLLSNPELTTEFIGGHHAEQTIELTKTLELGRRRKSRKQIAKIHLEKANLEFTDATRKLTKSVKLVFYQVVLLQEKLKLAKEIIKHNQHMFEMVQFQFQAGDIPVSQVGLANIQLQSAQRDLATLESELTLAYLELNGLMGTPLDATPTAIGRLETKVQSNLNIAKLKSHALEYRADLRSIKLNSQLTDSTLRLAKASNIPDLNIGGIAEHRPGEVGFGVKLSIPLPIFDRNRVEVEATKAQKLVDDSQITDTERRIISEVMAAYLTLNAAQQNLKFYDDNLLKLLNENLSLTRSAYELGEAQLLELILMQNEFVKTQFAYLDAIAAKVKAYVNLEAALGIPIHLVQ